MLKHARIALAVCALLSVWAAPSLAQMGAFSGFDSIRAGSIQSNARTGDFSIPKRFTVTRAGTDVSGDSAHGNATSKLIFVDGNVVVHMEHSLSLVGQQSSAESGPSTLTCDHLRIDGTRRLYHALGNVSYVEASRSTRADRADIDEATNQLRLEGHVSITGAAQSSSKGPGGFDTVRAATMSSNSNTGEFVIPNHFSASRQGVEISGDHAQGYVGKGMSVTGHVLVRIPRRSAMLTCERLQIDEAQRVYHALGNVRYSEPARVLIADRADMNETNSIVHLQGNVHISDTSTPEPVMHHPAQHTGK